ncbi:MULTISPECIES: YqzL family protein [Thermincola]|uniref:YqzL family protein n=1 Tax=Thermincola TaxID=278993 RepID=UPI0002F7F514|nr:MULTISPECIES: YqzL family protein [Thermincola]
MVSSDVFWKLFENTGHIGAYLLYKDYSNEEMALTGNNSAETQNVATGGEY